MLSQYSAIPWTQIRSAPPLSGSAVFGPRVKSSMPAADTVNSLAVWRQSVSRRGCGRLSLTITNPGSASTGRRVAANDVHHAVSTAQCANNVFKVFSSSTSDDVTHGNLSVCDLYMCDWDQILKCRLFSG